MKENCLFVKNTILELMRAQENVKRKLLTPMPARLQSLKYFNWFFSLGQDQKTEVINDELNPTWNKVNKICTKKLNSCDVGQCAWIVFGLMKCIKDVLSSPTVTTEETSR